MKKFKWSLMTDVYSKGTKRFFGIHININNKIKKKIEKYILAL
jgi:hypothetical protein